MQRHQPGYVAMKPYLQKQTPGCVVPVLGPGAQFVGPCSGHCRTTHFTLAAQTGRLLSCGDSGIMSSCYTELGLQRRQVQRSLILVYEMILSFSFPAMCTVKVIYTSAFKRKFIRRLHRRCFVAVVSMKPHPQLWAYHFLVFDFLFYISPTWSSFAE